MPNRFSAHVQLFVRSKSADCSLASVAFQLRSVSALDGFSAYIAIHYKYAADMYVKLRPTCSSKCTVEALVLDPYSWKG